MKDSYLLPQKVVNKFSVFSSVKRDAKIKFFSVIFVRFEFWRRFMCVPIFPPLAGVLRRAAAECCRRKGSQRAEGALSAAVDSMRFCCRNVPTQTDFV